MAPARDPSISRVIRTSPINRTRNLRALVGKCFALSPILLSTGTARSGMDEASYDAPSRLLRASYILSVSRKLVVSVKVRM
jgi:hypothetical protein